MVKILRKIGNSTGVIIDKTLLDLLGLRAGNRVDVSCDGGKLIVKPVRTTAGGKT
jgi:antitoxin component of MazEF toxin-antitoxin module